MQTTVPTLQDIRAAHERIGPMIHRTPVLTSQALNERTGAELFFKCENFQKIGAFKMRGAANAVSLLPAEVLAKGVCTHSSGNHAQAVARAAQAKGIAAHIVMPTSAPAVKKAAVLEYGARVIECAPTLEAREGTLKQVQEETGAAMVHPFDDYAVIAGQATTAVELMEDAPGLDFVLAPVGGGGLLAGVALAVHYLQPHTEVVAAEPEGADDTARSLAAGHVVPVVPSTIADGLLTTVGTRNFPIIQQHVKQVLTTNDQEIVAALRLVWERMKIVIEPSCAVPVAALLKYPEQFKGKRVGVILSGGNVDLGKLPF